MALLFNIVKIFIKFYIKYNLALLLYFIFIERQHTYKNVHTMVVQHSELNKTEHTYVATSESANGTLPKCQSTSKFNP